MRPVLPYYGGKWRAAPMYGPPVTGRIVEPFAGSAGYSCRYGADLEVVLVERYAPLAAAWRWLLSAMPAEVLDLPDVPRDGDVRAMGLPDGAACFVGFWLGKASSTPKRSPSAWSAGGVRPASCWGAQVRARIAEQLPLMTGWRIIEGDYTDAPDVVADWHIDPPYQVAGKHYPCGSRGIDYAALGAWCDTRRGRVTVCENAGADWRAWTHARAIKARRGVSREVWTAHDTGERCEREPWWRP
jgi:hypothetical protein